MEIETKILNVDVGDVKKKLYSLGAKETQNVRLVVDWYSIKDAEKNGHPWYLRIRTNSNGSNEITWKSLPVIKNNTRHSEEINLKVTDASSAKLILERIGFENYAHQEKDRISFSFKDWLFDLDQYPEMPAYLEIEGKNHKHVQEAISLLGLDHLENTGEGETKLIREKYGLNWNDMQF